MKALEEQLTEIAQATLNVETLETRYSDRLDFYDLPVWFLRDALEAAFKAGREQGRQDQITS